MSGLDQRPEKQAKQQARVQERVQARDAPAQPVGAPQRPQMPKPTEPQQEAQTSADKVGAVLMALAGKAPRTMPGALTWSSAGAVRVEPQEVNRRVATAADLRAHLTQQPTGRAGDVLRALTGQSGQVVATHRAEMAWSALVVAVQAGQTVVAGGGDDAPTERHHRSRASLVIGVDAAEPRTVTLLDADGGEETVAFAVFCDTFAEIAVAAPANGTNRRADGL